MGRRHVLVIERDDVAAGREAPQRVEVVVAAEGHVVDDLRRRTRPRGRQHPQADAEGRGGRSAHAGQLAAAHDAHPRGAVQIHAETYCVPV